jgi:hypothetical protein
MRKKDSRLRGSGQSRRSSCWFDPAEKKEHILLKHEYQEKYDAIPLLGKDGP